MFTCLGGHTLSGVRGSEWYKDRVLTPREAARVKNGWLMERLTTILPELMRREGFDMWVVISREYNEDPTIMSLLPEPQMYARRRTILVFTLKQDGTIERLTLSRYGLGEFYQAMWDPDKEDQWDCVGRIVRERAPKSIGINTSETFAFGDGLTHTEYTLLMKAIGPDFAARTRGAEGLAVGWLERRSQGEIAAYPGIVEMAHSIVSEAFSSAVVHPGVTTTEDVVWWIRKRMTEMGVRPWFQPSISIQAFGQLSTPPGSHGTEPRKLILPGDVLHCDVGIMYLGLCTDTQNNAYVLKMGEIDAPPGLQQALATGNRFQDICTTEFVAGRSGNQILHAALKQAQSEGIKASLYTHPLGVHGHAAGPTIGLWDRQGGVPGQGDYKLFEDTCYALELNIKKAVPEWDGQEVQIALEQDILFSGGKCHYMAGRQTKWHLIG